MNNIKKYLGLVWMALSPTIIIFLVLQTIQKTQLASEAAKANTLLQWVIILLVFTPISIGFFIFGLYSFKGEYASNESE